MQGFLAFLFFIIVGGGIYVVKKYYIDKVTHFVQIYYEDLNRYVLIDNINHITENEHKKRYFILIIVKIENFKKLFQTN